MNKERHAIKIPKGKERKLLFTEANVPHVIGLGQWAQWAKGHQNILPVAILNLAAILD